MAQESNNSSADNIAVLRTLSHDLSNALENITQASYLLSQTKLGENGEKWLALIESATKEASRLTREIREILKTQF